MQDVQGWHGVMNLLYHGMRECIGLLWVLECMCGRGDNMLKVRKWKCRSLLNPLDCYAEMVTMTWMQADVVKLVDTLS